MIESIFAIAFGLSSIYNGADLSIGMGAQTKEGSAYPYRMRTPLGLVKIETSPRNNFRLFAQHISSIPDTHDGSGINLVGAEFTVHIGK